MLKKSLLTAFAVFSLICIYTACQQEEVAPPLIEETVPDRAALSSSTPTITVSNGLLVFASESHAATVLADLEAAAISADDAFVSEYSTLDEDELNDMEDLVGFNYLQPYIDFEDDLNFSSLRAKVEADIQTWLDNGGSESDDPDNHFIGDDLARTILNEQAEVMIGGSIYKFFENGSYIAITDGSFTTLTAIRNGGDPDDYNNVVWFAKNAESCKTNKYTNIYKHSGSGKFRMKCRVGIYYYPWGCGFVAKTKSYKKKNNGKWRKYRTKIDVCVGGKDCKPDGTMSGPIGPKCKLPMGKKKKSRSIRLTLEEGCPTTKTLNVQGNHVSSKVGSFLSTLQF